MQETDIGRGVGTGIHQIPETDLGESGSRAIHIHEAQGVAKLVVEPGRDAAEESVLGGGFRNHRTFSQVTVLLSIVIHADQRHRITQGDKKGRDVVGRIRVHVTLPVAAGMNEDDIGERVIVIVVRHAEIGSIGGQAGVGHGDHVLDQSLQIRQQPTTIRAGPVIGDIGQLVTVVPTRRQHRALDEQSPSGLQSVVLGKTEEMGLEEPAIVRGRLDEIEFSRLTELEVAIRGDGGQVTTTISLEADPDHQDAQGILL